MNIKAAVTHEKGADFKIEDVMLDAPKHDEVLVRIVASGVCHTDISIRDQFKPVPLPAVLGHEGAGIVEKVGEGVKHLQPGDHVVLSYSSCGECENCLTGKAYACDLTYQLNFAGRMPDETCRLHQHGRQISHFFGQSSFAHYSVVPKRNVVKVDKDVDLKMLAPLGCGVITGSGAVFNKLKPSMGSSLAVFGCGTVGLSAIMAAKIAGCSEIIGVDIHDNRLELAKELGATHTINAKTGDPVQAIKEITGGGAHFSIETSANPKVLRQAFDCLSISGCAALIGGAPLGTEVSLDMNLLLRDRTVTGVLQGNGVPQAFIPKLIKLYKDGKFPFDKLVKFYEFEQINQAVHDMEKGATIKPILVMSH